MSSYLKALKAESENQDPIVKMLQSPKDLPSLPTILNEIQKIINDPRSGGSDLKEVIEKDPTMTAAVLKLINSAYYAIPGGVANLQRAIAYLGYDAIYQVALAVSVLKSFKTTDFPNFKLGDFWLHSLCVATWCDEISKAIKFAKASDTFTAGLLHDLGKVFLAKHDPDRLVKIVDQCYQENKTFLEVEKQHISFAHTVIGEKLASHWRLPRSIVFSMKYHHEMDPTKRTGAVPEENQTIDIVIVANAMAHKSKAGNGGYPSRDSVPMDIVKRLGVNDAQLARLGQQVEERMKAAAAFLSLL